MLYQARAIVFVVWDFLEFSITNQIWWCTESKKPYQCPKEEKEIRRYRRRSPKTTLCENGGIQMRLINSALYYVNASTTRPIFSND